MQRSRRQTVFGAQAGCCSSCCVPVVSRVPCGCLEAIPVSALIVAMQASTTSDEPRPGILRDTTELFSHPSGWRVHVRKGPIAAAAAIERYVWVCSAQARGQAKA